MRTWMQYVLALVLLIVLSDNILWYLQFPLADYKCVIDPLCMWDATTGTHQSTEDPQVVETVGLDGLRRAYPLNTAERPYHILFMGCSYTYGDSVRDSDTYVWKLNELCPNVLCDNGGVKGYGPYRSYIRLQRLLKRRKYDLVVYAMIDEHSKRCSLPTARELTSTYFGIDHPLGNLYAMPFTALSSDFRFIDHPLHRYAFPADGISTLSNFLNQLFTAFTIRRQEVPAKNKQVVIFANIIERMAQLAAAFDSKFMLMSLDGDDRPDELIGRREIYPNWITLHNNAYFRSLQLEDRIGHKPKNHPNAAVHSYWAHRLAAYLQQEEVFNSLIAYRQFRRDNCHRSLHDWYANRQRSAKEHE